MIESLLISAILTFVNPADPSGKTMYPSGVKDCDNFYYQHPPYASKNPNLVLPYQVYDGENNLIQPGIYESIISTNSSLILLVQSGEIKARLPVSNVTNLPVKRFIPVIEAKKLSSGHVQVIYKVNDAEIYSILATP